MYKLLSTRVVDDSLFTKVEYTFADGSKSVVEVAHFMPKDKTQVITNIEDREISEQIKVNANIKNLLIKSDIDKMVQ